MIELEEWEKGSQTPIESALWHTLPTDRGLGLAPLSRAAWACGRERPTYVFVRRIVPGGALPGRACGRCIRAVAAARPSIDPPMILREDGFRV